MTRSGVHPGLLKLELTESVFAKELGMTVQKMRALRDLLMNQSDKAIVETLVALSKSLDMLLIAEGAETLEQLDYLLDKGCTKYQGYLFSKPLPIEAFELFLSSFQQPAVPGSLVSVRDRLIH